MRRARARRGPRGGASYSRSRREEEGWPPRRAARARGRGLPGWQDRVGAGNVAWVMSSVRQGLFAAMRLLPPRLLALGLALAAVACGSAPSAAPVGAEAPPPP